MAHTISEPLHLTMTGPDGAAVELDLAAGDVELAPEIAEVLVAQGLATPTKPKATKAASTTEG